MKDYQYSTFSTLFSIVENNIFYWNLWNFVDIQDKPTPYQSFIVISGWREIETLNLIEFNWIFHGNHQILFWYFLLNFTLSD